MEEITKEQDMIRRLMALAEDLGLDPVQQERFAKEAIEKMEKELGIKLRDV